MFHSSRLWSIKFEETVRCQCHSGNCLDGTPDGNKSFKMTCGVAASGSIAASSTPGSASEPWGESVRLQSNHRGQKKAKLKLFFELIFFLLMAKLAKLKYPGNYFSKNRRKLS